MRKDCGALEPELPRYVDCGWEYCCRGAPLDEPGLPNPVQPRLFCGAAWLRGAAWLLPGSPNRRHPPAAWFWQTTTLTLVSPWPRASTLE